MINVKFNFLVLTSGEWREIGLGSVQVRGKNQKQIQYLMKLSSGFFLKLYLNDL